MKITKVRFSNCVVAFDDDRMPVTHRFQNDEQGVTFEVRNNDHHLYVYGTLDASGAYRHVGTVNGTWFHHKRDLYQHIGTELFKLAGELGVADHYIWPFIEQLPVYTDTGVDVEEALALTEPIKDLLARGASPTEVISSLGVTQETIEFVLGTKIPPQVLSDDDSTIW